MNMIDGSTIDGCGAPVVKRKKTLYVVAGVLVLVAVVFHGWRWLSIPTAPSPEELAGVAIFSDATPEDCQDAALKLAGLGSPAVPYMRRVLAESKSPEVRAAAIQGLVVAYDITSMDAYLDGLNDPSLPVRMSSATAMNNLLSMTALPDDPPEKRQEAIDACRRHWEQMLTWPHIQKKLAEQRANQ